jgi:hypothetical protein
MILLLILIVANIFAAVYQMILLRRKISTLKAEKAILEHLFEKAQNRLLAIYKEAPGYHYLHCSKYAREALFSVAEDGTVSYLNYNEDGTPVQTCDLDNRIGPPPF